MSCKKGGLVLLRHNDVAAEWHHLCAQALSPAAVSDEPLIHRCRDGNAGATAAGAEEPPELRGDVAVHGFWRRGTTAIFDIRITDTNAPTYRGQDPHKVLAKQEKEKKAPRDSKSKKKSVSPKPSQGARGSKAASPKGPKHQKRSASPIAPPASDVEHTSDSQIAEAGKATPS